MTVHPIKTYTLAALVSFCPLALTAQAASDDPPADSGKDQEKPDDGKHHQILKGAAAGAAVGHFAGHHAVRGAAVGAAAGAWKEHHDKKAAKKRAQEDKENATH